MKKINLIFGLLLSTLIFTSCKKSDIAPNTTNTSTSTSLDEQAPKPEMLAVAPVNTNYTAGKFTYKDGKNNTYSIMVVNANGTYLYDVDNDNKTDFQIVPKSAKDFSRVKVYDDKGKIVNELSFDYRMRIINNVTYMEGAYAKVNQSFTPQPAFLSVDREKSINFPAWKSCVESTAGSLGGVAGTVLTGVISPWAPVVVLGGIGVYCCFKSRYSKYDNSELLCLRSYTEYTTQVDPSGFMTVNQKSAKIFN